MLAQTVLIVHVLDLGHLACIADAPDVIRYSDGADANDRTGPFASGSIVGIDVFAAIFHGLAISVGLHVFHEFVGTEICRYSYGQVTRKESDTAAGLTVDDLSESGHDERCEAGPTRGIRVIGGFDILLGIVGVLKVLVFHTRSHLC